MDDKIGRTGDSSSAGLEDYRASVRRIIQSEVSNLVDEEIRNAAKELVEEQRRAIREAVEEHRRVIREVVEEEKVAVRARVDEIRKSIARLYLSG